MNREEFNKRIEESLNKIKHTLTIKGAEYDRNNNPFHAFETAAELDGKATFEITWEYARKHFVSIRDMKKDVIEEDVWFSQEIIEEKYNDLLIYTLIEKEMMLHHSKIREIK